MSGPAAAWWHGMLPSAPDRVELTVERGCGLRGRAGVRLRRRDLDRRDVACVDGLALTARPLTVLETAAAVVDGSAFLDRALQRHVDFPAVYAAYCRNLGAYRGARIADLLVAAADRADSAAERLVIRLLRRAGITGWQVGVPFGPWTIDVAFPEAKVAVEVDGWAWHVDVDRFRADRHKGNALTRAGWTLLRFTWHDLVNRPGYVVAEIRAALGMITSSLRKAARSGRLRTELVIMAGTAGGWEARGVRRGRPARPSPLVSASTRPGAAGWPASAIQLASIRWPPSVSTDSGWNCTPWMRQLAMPQ